MRRGFTLTEMVLAFALVAVAILALIGVFTAGIQMSARSRDLVTGTEVARQVLERIRIKAHTGGFAYIPAGDYSYDGRAGQPATGSAPMEFPPAPYPEIVLNGQRFQLVVTGQEPIPGKIKAVRVEAWYGPQSKIVLETHLHP